MHPFRYLLNFYTIEIFHEKAKVRNCYRVKPGGPKNFLLDVKTITKSPGDGIAASVKSCNLDKKGRIIWF